MPPLKIFQKKITSASPDAYLVTNSTDIRYLTGGPSSDSWLMVFPRQVYYLTDGRYVEEVKARIKGVTVRDCAVSLSIEASDLLKKRGVKDVAIDSRHFTLAEFSKFKKDCGRSCRISVHNGWVGQLRAVKSAEEIKAIKRALVLNHEAFRIVKRIARAGVRERDILIKLEDFVRSRGCGFSFDPIIASGPHSSYPHASVTVRKLRKNDVLLVDMGIDWKGYKSDLTRMFFLGKIPPLVKKVHEDVTAAQGLAIQSIRAGVKAADVDQQARKFLKNKGLSRFFTHSLGHGVGLDIHEAPRVSQRSPDILQEGMVVTVEPAVYLPGKFGIRIEDMVVVTKNGARVLSH